MDTISNFSPSDIIADRARPTAIWRVMELRGDQVRLLRCNKFGAAHKMVKNKSGDWKPIANYSNYSVVGHYDPTHRGAPKKGKTLAQGVGHNAGPGKLPARAPASRSVGGTITGSLPTNGDGLDLFLTAMENFYQSGAEGCRRTRKELAGVH